MGGCCRCRVGTPCDLTLPLLRPLPPSCACSTKHRPGQGRAAAPQRVCERIPFHAWRWGAAQSSLPRGQQARGRACAACNRAAACVSRGCALAPPCKARAPCTRARPAGYECKEFDGSFMVAFPAASPAVEWAMTLQLALLLVPWPQVRGRMSSLGGTGWYRKSVLVVSGTSGGGDGETRASMPHHVLAAACVRTGAAGPARADTGGQWRDNGQGEQQWASHVQGTSASVQREHLSTRSCTGVHAVLFCGCPGPCTSSSMRTSLLPAPENTEQPRATLQTPEAQSARPVSSLQTKMMGSYTIFDTAAGLVPRGARARGHLPGPD